MKFDLYTLAWVKFSWLAAALNRCAAARPGFVRSTARSQLVNRQASVNGPQSGGRRPHARFPGSALTRADFSRATLEKADLRGAELNITAGFESLRGAIMTTAQFLALAR